MLDAYRESQLLRYEREQDPEIQSRIAQYEMAYRMQTSIPEVMDVSGEPESIYEMYGPESRIPGTYAANCLLARRLVERASTLCSSITAVGTSISIYRKT